MRGIVYDPEKLDPREPRFRDMAVTTGSDYPSSGRIWQSSLTARPVPGTALQQHARPGARVDGDIDAMPVLGLLPDVGRARDEVVDLAELFRLDVEEAVNHEAAAAGSRGSTGAVMLNGS